MGVVDTWRNWVRPKSERLTYYRMPDAHVVDEPVSARGVESEKAYVQISALSVHLAHDREWFTRYVPGVAAVVTTSSAAGSREFIRVAGSNDLAALQASGIGKTIIVNKAVSPLIPFTGGSIEVVMGLVAFETKNSLPSLLELVSDVTGLVGGPAAAAAADSVGAVVSKGFEALLCNGEKDLVLSLAHRWDGADADASTSRTDGSDALVLREGFWVLLNERSTARDDLWLKDGQLMRGTTSSSLSALDGVDYMVLRIDTRPTRDDWQEFCRVEIDLRDIAAIRGDAGEAIAQNRAAMTKIVNSSLFTRSDKQRLVNELRAWSPGEGAPVVHPGAPGTPGAPPGDRGADDGAMESAEGLRRIVDGRSMPQEDRLVDFLD
jgi:hypothetical protein